MASHILVIEDDTAIREMICFTLKHEGFGYHAVADGEQGLEQVAEQTPDLILLDWMLPKMDGIEFLRRLRGNPQTAPIPVIMLTARDDNDDKVKGLSVGADDYMTKPFSPAELVARLHAVLRRCQVFTEEASTQLEVSGLVLDPESHRVTAAGQHLGLGPTEFRLLQFFMAHPERAYSRSQLLDHLWASVYVEERTVDVHIRRLRKALAPSGHDVLIDTVRGVGYRFSAVMLS
jgi:two-component system phosphate regulon response regulator PhoB